MDAREEILNQILIKPNHVTIAMAKIVFVCLALTGALNLYSLLSGHNVFFFAYVENIFAVTNYGQNPLGPLIIKYAVLAIATGVTVGALFVTIFYVIFYKNSDFLDWWDYRLFIRMTCSNCNSRLRRIQPHCHECKTSFSPS